MHYVILNLSIMKNLRIRSRIVLSDLSFIAPAVVFYIIGKLSSSQKKHFVFKIHLQILEWIKTCFVFKMIECTFENSIQIFILIFVILLKKSDSKTIHGLENLISNDETEILAISGILSVASLVITEVQWYSSSKNFYLPLKAKIFYGFNIFLFVIKRVFSIILYFAPLMGIFDLMGHWKMGKLDFRIVIEQEILNSPLISDEVISIQNWKQILNYSEMTNWKITYYYGFFILLIVIHLVLLFLLKCKFVKNFFSKENMSQKFFHILIQLFCPKVHQDWDEEIATVHDAIQNYIKVKTEMILSLILFLLEDLVMCTPIWILSYNIYQRNTYLYKEDFPLLEEEKWSTKLAYTLSFVSPVVFIIFPLIQYGLFILYNKFSHPWSILLQENPTTPKFFEEGIINPKNGNEETKISNVTKIEKKKP